MANLPGTRTPGRTQPGLRSPNAAQPGLDTPKSGDHESVTATGVALDATGVTQVGTVDGDRVSSVGTTLSNDPGDVEYVVTVTPTVGVGPATVEFEVTNASATADSTADVTVDAIVERDL